MHLALTKKATFFFFFLTNNPDLGTKYCINTMSSSKKVEVCKSQEDSWWVRLRSSKQSPILSEVPLPCNPTLSTIWLKCDPAVPTQNVAGPEEGERREKNESSMTASPGLWGEQQSLVIYFFHLKLLCYLKDFTVLPLSSKQWWKIT